MILKEPISSDETLQACDSFTSFASFEPRASTPPCFLVDLCVIGIQGMDLCLGDSDPSTVEPFSLRDGTTITATASWTGDKWLIHASCVLRPFVFDGTGRCEVQTWTMSHVARHGPCHRTSVQRDDSMVHMHVPPSDHMRGTCHASKVKSFNETRGFGFLKIPGANMDLYFHGRDTRHLELRVGSCGMALGS